MIIKKNKKKKMIKLILYKLNILSKVFKYNFNFIHNLKYLNN